MSKNSVALFQHPPGEEEGSLISWQIGHRTRLFTDFWYNLSKRGCLIRRTRALLAQGWQHQCPRLRALGSLVVGEHQGTQGLVPLARQLIRREEVNFSEQEKSIRQPMLR
ncbi:MAG: hypothetical protein DRI61_08060 [Chloroflexi bacterium]|nr:MAG: hypothetical protein DRI61_08060 [Chloroflexota bacterium]